MNNKKGLSTVVSTLIIILLVFISIGIIWMVIKKVIETGAENINFQAKCREISIKSTSLDCDTSVNPQTCDVGIQREAGGDPIAGVKIVLNTARLKKDGFNFEVAVDPDLAINYKKGEDIDIREILKSEDIFFDVKKGELASEAEMTNVFETTDRIKIAEQIIKTGDIQLTAEYRQGLRDEKKRRILEIIHRNGVDPKTKLPHPMVRLENAFNEVKVHIDEFKSPEDQVQDVLTKLRPILPISFEKKKLQIIIPATYAPKCYPVVKSFGNLEKDEWQNDGSWLTIIEIPAGMSEEFFEKLNKITHGDLESKEL